MWDGASWDRWKLGEIKGEVKTLIRQNAQAILWKQERALSRGPVAAEGAPEHLPTAPVQEGGRDLHARSLAVAVESNLVSSTARGLLELAVRGNPCQLPLC